MKQDCNHDIVIKYGVAECQNCGTEESKILKQNKMEQTAVNWLVRQLSKEWTLEDRDLYLIDQAKEMEKQQIIDAYVNGEHQQGFEAEAEQYYNKTFKNK